MIMKKQTAPGLKIAEWKCVGLLLCVDREKSEEKMTRITYEHIAIRSR